MHKKSKFQKYFSNNAINLDIEIDITPHDIYIASDIMTLELANFAIYNIQNIYTIHTIDIKRNISYTPEPAAFVLNCIFATFLYISPINSTECYVIPWLAFYNLPILEPATALCGRYDSIFLPQWAWVWKLCTKQEFPGHFFTTTQSFLHRKCALISQNKA